MTTLRYVGTDPIVKRLDPSPEQLPAVTARDVDVLVHAGAGTGKTRTLIARFLSLVAEGNALRSIVAITFTEKAALEMRSRLRDAIGSYLQDETLDPATRDKWQQTERDLDSARIGTIHALCSEILRRHPAEARIDPRFTVLDEGQALILRANALDETMAAAVVDEACEPLFALLQVEAVRSLLEKLLGRRLELAGTGGDSVGDSSGDVVDAGANEILERWAAGICALANNPELLHSIQVLRVCRDYAVDHDEARADKAYPLVCEILDLWDATLPKHSDLEWAATGHAFWQIQPCLKSVGKDGNWGDAKPKALFKQIKRLLNPDDVEKPPDPEADLRMLALRPIIRALNADVNSRYLAAKQNLRTLDFDDLEAGALALLQNNPSVRTEWQQQVAALLVDEFQDTNLRQAALVKLLSRGPGCLFIVGDAQQSIYGFRGADLRVFRREGDRIVAEEGARFTLARSYRTHPALLEAMERLLSPIFDDGITSDFRAPFVPLIPERTAAARGIDTPYVELILGEGNKAAGLNSAANALADRLHRLHANGVPWGEIAILCRGSKAFAYYEDALERTGIPNVTVAGRGFYDRPEVRDVLNALHAIADPFDNLAMIGLLRSPAVGMNDGEILRICDAAPKGKREAPAAGAIWKQLRRSDHAVAANAVALVNRLNALVGRVTVAALLSTLLGESNYVAALLQAGQVRAARNLTKLLDEAQAAPSPSVTEFLERIKALRSATTREGEARADESGAVQIMTIHAAKGLEFTVVVIGDAASSAVNRADAFYVNENNEVIFSAKVEEGGEGLLYTTARALGSAMSEAESERLLYVAATRARDLLIINGHCTESLASTSSTAGNWLARLVRLGRLTDLVGEAFAGKGTCTINKAESYACTVHPFAPGAVISAVAPMAGVAGPETHAPLLWNPILLEPLASKPAQAQQPSRSWRVASAAHEHGSLAWVIGEIIHAAIAAWRFPIEANMTAFDAWAIAAAQARGIHQANDRAWVLGECKRLLSRLHASPFFAQLDAARRFTELPFHCLVDADASPYGRMDLLYEAEGGGWTIVDFKSNNMQHVRSVPDFIRARGYDVALRRYGRAVEMFLQVRPQLQLCFLNTPAGISVVPVPFDAD